MCHKGINDGSLAQRLSMSLLRPRFSLLKGLIYYVYTRNQRGYIFIGFSAFTLSSIKSFNKNMANRLFWILYTMLCVLDGNLPNSA